MARKTPEYKKTGMTEAAFRSYVISGLRQKSRWWKPARECQKASYVGTKINKKTGRLAKHYKCNICGNEFISKEMQADHIQPVVNPKTGFTTWDSYIYNMFGNAEDYQYICKGCHSEKTKKEREIAKLRK